MSSTDFESRGGDNNRGDSSPSLMETGGGSAFVTSHALTAVTAAMLNVDDQTAPFNIFHDISGRAGGFERANEHLWSTSGKLGGDMEVFDAKRKMKLVAASNGRYSNGGGTPSSSVSDTDGVIIVKEEAVHSPASPIRSTVLNGLTLQHEDPSPYSFATLNSSSGGSSHSPYGDAVSPYGLQGVGGIVVSTSAAFGGGGGLRSTYGISSSPLAQEASPYYREQYFNNQGEYGGGGGGGGVQATRIISPYDGPIPDQNNSGHPGQQTILHTDIYRYKQSGGGTQFAIKGPVTIDLPSPDSGIGTESITPRDNSSIQPGGFNYEDLCPGNGGGGLMTSDISGASSNAGSVTGRTTPGGTVQAKSTRPWHEFGRTSEADKIQIPKLFSAYGFRYYLESPISTSQRREDDRITYINKGQFYGITLDHVHDPDKPLKSQTVKSVVMLVFREEKSPEDEIKAWQFWHSRQHSVKQRILDADTKNSVGLVGCIDEVAHNAIAVYWNPLESSAKINVAVQCLSTDFSSQKGVKGLPLHLQIDTYDDPRDPHCPIYHRGYSQIKVFCDKGAERKTRDEERRAAKRKLTATGRKKLDELYHTSCDRTEFYAMSDIAKPPVLFSPAEDLDKVNLTPLAEFHGYYGGGGGGASEGGASDHSGAAPGGRSSPGGASSTGSGSPHPHHHHQHLHLPHHHPQPPTTTTSTVSTPTTTLKFHNTFPPDSPPPPQLPPPPPTQPHPPPQPPPSSSSSVVSSLYNGGGHLHHILMKEKGGLVTTNGVGLSNGNNNHKDQGGSLMDDDSSVFGSPAVKRLRLVPPTSERLMLYVRQEPEEVFTALHLVPPSTLALLAALEEKFKISMGSVKNLYRRNTKGVVAKVDDDMLKHYCHEDTFSLEVKASENDDAFDVTLAELQTTIMTIPSTLASSTLQLHGTLDYSSSLGNNGTTNGPSSNSNNSNNHHHD